MRRPPVSIVILAWNAWDETQACLESLRPTLGVHDQVVVVDNGSVDATPHRLRLFPWVEVVTNEENRGFAGGCNQGAALARHDVVVFLNNDTVLTGRWLDALVAPFGDPAVGATGPRSNFVSGPQVAEGASYAGSDRAAMRAFARRWAEEHRGRTSPADRLVGFCLAVRRSAFEAVGGFDEGYEIGGFEDDDLCRRLSGGGWQLVIAHESFVHHAGHRSFDANDVDWFAQQEVNRQRFEDKFGDRSERDFPLVSACLIVRDEEDNLPGCLASLDGFVDEVVVYDTGSTDGTVDLARELGATVLLGYWDDDFSRARNEALAACRGEWIAWLDADETLVCDDVDALRADLAKTATVVDGYSVVIENLTGAGVGSMFVHSACRLFRRSRCEWTGRLHEQVAGRIDHRPVATVTLERARIRHTGYLAQAMVERSKAERNLRVAEAEVERSEGWERGFSLTSLGRAYLTAGRAEEAFDACRRGAEETQNAITRRLALRTAIEALVAMGRLDEALEWLGRLREASTRQVLADLLEANIRRQLGDHERSLALLEPIGASEFDDDGFEYDGSMFAHHRAESLAALGRYGEAADVLLGALDAKGVLDTHLGSLVDHLERAGRPLAELADVIPEERVQLFLAQVLQLRGDVADRVLEASWDRLAREPVLAVAATLAPRLALERTLVWASRLREHGLEAFCPLVARATDVRVRPGERLRSAAVAWRAFGDRRARGVALEAAAELAGSAARGRVREELAMLAPDLLDELDATFSSTPPAAGRPPAAGSRYLASIVVPILDDLASTVDLLETIGEVTAPEDFEVVLVDRPPPAEPSELAAMVSGDVRFVRPDAAAGHGAARNEAAAVATGEVLVFLGAHVVPRHGWLEALLRVVDARPDVAAVGPTVSFVDGSVFHAGVELVEDRRSDEPALVVESRWLGRPGGEGPEPGVPEVQAVGGAAVAVRAEAFREAGGFDDRLGPGYGAVDLCLRLAETGRQVSVEPSSRMTYVGPTVVADRVVGTEDEAERFGERWLGAVVADRVLGRRASGASRLVVGGTG